MASVSAPMRRHLGHRSHLELQLEAIRIIPAEARASALQALRVKSKAEVNLARRPGQRSRECKVGGVRWVFADRSASVDSHDDDRQTATLRDRLDLT